MLKHWIDFMLKISSILLLMLFILSCGEDSDSVINPVNENGAYKIKRDAKIITLNDRNIWYYDVDKKVSEDFPIERYKQYWKYISKGRFFYKGNSVNVFQIKLGSVEDSTKFYLGEYYFEFGDSLYGTSEHSVDGQNIQHVSDIVPLYIKHEGITTIDHSEYDVRLIEYDLNGLLYEAWELTLISESQEYSKVEVIIPGIGYISHYSNDESDSTYHIEKLYQYELY